MSLPVFPRIHIKAVLLVGLACAGLSACSDSRRPTSPSSAVAAPALAVDRIERPEPVSILCTGNGQLCTPRYASTVAATTFIQVRFVTSVNHCANVTVALFVDAVESASALLRPDESSPAWNVNVTRGTHLVELEGRGVAGGCNTGRLTGWAGTAFIAAD